MTVSQFLAVMSASATSDGKQFRAAAAPLFISIVGLDMPLYFGIALLKYGPHVHWKPVLIGAASIVPAAVIGAGLMCLFFSVRLSPAGIRAQSVWGWPSFIRWPDIKEAREFKFFSLRWLRLYSSTGSAVTWVALFQAHPGLFKEEIIKLAPPESPVHAHIK